VSYSSIVESVRSNTARICEKGLRSAIKNFSCLQPVILRDSKSGEFSVALELDVRRCATFTLESFYLNVESLTFNDESFCLTHESLIFNDEFLTFNDESFYLTHESLIFKDESLTFNEDALNLSEGCDRLCDIYVALRWNAIAFLEPSHLNDPLLV